MKQTFYTPDDFDRHGMLQLPWLFWGILILQARTCLLFLIAGASRSNGQEILSLFYPDTQLFWTGMAFGLPALLSLVMAMRRHLWPKLWRCWRWVLVVSVTVTIGAQGNKLWQSAVIQEWDIILLLLDIAALAYLVMNHRLADCFKPHETL